jgi:hypothetical protein
MKYVDTVKVTVTVTVCRYNFGARVRPCIPRLNGAGVALKLK